MRHLALHPIARSALAVCLSASAIPSVLAEDGPPKARVQEVRDTHFGTEVVDPYRWMEAGGDDFAAFLKAQNDYTRRTFAPLAQERARWLARIRALQAGTDAVRFVSQAGGRYFFLETPADGKDARLMTRALDGGDKRLLLAPSQLGKPGARASIDFYGPSDDGKRVAVAISHGGAEDWVLRVLDVGSGELLDDTVAGIASPVPSWAADGSGFYYARLQPLAEGAPPSAKYDNVRVHFHALGTAQAQDRAVFGAGVDPDIDVPARSTFPEVAATRDGHLLLASVSRGTDSNPALWLRDLRAKTPRWRAIAGYDDEVSSIALHGDRVYIISERDSANGRVLSFDALRETVADAKVWLPESDIVLSAYNGFLAAAADAMYVAGQRDGESVIRRVPFDDPAKAQELKPPASGSIIEFVVDEAAPGVSYALQAPTLSPRLFRYDPDTGASTDTRLRAPDPADFSGIVTRRIEVPGTGGARVPLTITARKDLKPDGSHPTLLVAYGAYGVIVPMWFSAPDLAWYERGGVIAFVHARGGGEKGAAWHEAGRRTNKQRTIDDVIAAAQWLIDSGYTSPEHLAVAGKSAGGIAAGGALTQRPELFRAALIRVGVTDLLRIEHSTGGPANTIEYGSVKNEDEFRVLHAISPYNRVRDGVAYPAVLLETGVNDPRVPPWQLAKMTARLQAATASDRPILLRVDYDAGHGLGSDKSQVAELLADEYTFLDWQLR